jgi:hypothetical protein
MKKVIVRWAAVYETVIEVPENATEHEIEELAVDIKIDVPGSEYQQDTWEVVKISPEEKW